MNTALEKRMAERRAMLAALEEIVDEADQSNGGKGAQLPIVLHIREIAIAAIRFVKQSEQFKSAR
jgi:hypothetical protein